MSSPARRSTRSSGAVAGAALVSVRRGGGPPRADASAAEQPGALAVVPPRRASARGRKDAREGQQRSAAPSESPDARRGATAADAVVVEGGDATPVGPRGDNTALLHALVAALQQPQQQAPPPRPPDGSQPRVAAAAPAAPKDAMRDKYAGEPGLALDAWAAKARRMLLFYDGLTDARAVAWLATGLEGAAGDWYDAHTAAQVGRALSSPDALIAELRARFQPVNAEETARRELDALRQGKGTVNEYATRFHQLVAHLPNDGVGTRIFQFRRGLSSSIEDRLVQAEPQPATLGTAIALAARIEGRSNHATQSLAAAAVSELSTATAVPAAGTANIALATRVAELEALVQALQSSRPAAGGGRRSPKGEETRRQVPGLSSDEARRRMDQGLCLYCGRANHIARDCIDRVARKPPTISTA